MTAPDVDLTEDEPDLTGSDVGDLPDPISMVVVALPQVTIDIPHDPAMDVDGGLHSTLVFAEDPDPEILACILDLTEQVALTTAPFTVSVSGRGRLGPQDMAVLFLESRELSDVHDQVEASPCVPESKYPEWVAHVSLSESPEFPIDEYDTSGLTDIPFDRVAVWYGPERFEFFLTGLPDTSRGEAVLEAEAAGYVIVSSGVSIPTIDTGADLALAVEYATTHPAARWYIHKRAAALGLTASLPATWSPPPRPRDDELPRHGPGGVQAAAGHYIRMRSYGQSPDDRLYAELMVEARAQGMTGDPLVAAATLWHNWQPDPRPG